MLLFQGLDKVFFHIYFNHAALNVFDKSGDFVLHVFQGVFTFIFGLFIDEGGGGFLKEEGLQAKGKQGASHAEEENFYF